MSDLLVIPDVGKTYWSTLVYDTPSEPLRDFQVLLWVNDIHPDDSTVLGDLQEATWLGYLRFALPRSTFGAAAIIDHVANSTAVPAPTFSNNSLDSQPVYGWALVAMDSGALLFVQRFNPSVSLAANTALSLDPFTLKLGTYPGETHMTTLILPGPVEVSTLGVPAGVDVTVTLTGGGGGGAWGNKYNTTGGGGGGGGGLASAIVPASVWALGGTISIGAGGATGIEPVGGRGASFQGGGFGGSDTVLTLGGLARMTAHGGGGATQGNIGPASNGGAGGTAVIDPSVTTLATATGQNGFGSNLKVGNFGGNAAGQICGAGRPGISDSDFGHSGVTPGAGGGGGVTNIALTVQTNGGDGLAGSAVVSWVD